MQVGRSFRDHHPTKSHSSYLLAGRSVPEAAIHIYDMSFFTGFGVSAVIYWSLNQVFPAAGASKSFQEIDHSGMSDAVPMDDEYAKEDDLDGKSDEKVEGTASVRSVAV